MSDIDIKILCDRVPLPEEARTRLFEEFAHNVGYELVDKDEYVLSVDEGVSPEETADLIEHMSEAEILEQLDEGGEELDQNRLRVRMFTSMCTKGEYVRAFSEQEDIDPIKRDYLKAVVARLDEKRDFHSFGTGDERTGYAKHATYQPAP